MEQNVDIPAVGGSVTGGGLLGLSLTIQFLGQVVLEIFKVFPVDRVQQRFRSRFLSFPIQVAAIKIFSQSRAPQCLPRILLDRSRGFSHFSPPEKKCEDPAHQGSELGAESSSWTP